jgi:P27 family predicted phage terminase small subunit
LKGDDATKMGQRGPAPLPSAARKARGDSRKIGSRKLKELGATEPRPAKGIPEMPESLSDGAKQEWDRLVPDLAAVDGLLALIDSDALSAYCEDVATLRSLRETHQRLGNVGREIRQHEWIAEPGIKGMVERCALCGATREEAEPTCPSGRLYLNPVLKEIDVVEARCMLHRREFGMTPSARTRVQVAAVKEKPKNPFSDLAAEALQLRPN